MAQLRSRISSTVFISLLTGWIPQSGFFESDKFVGTQLSVETKKEVPIDTPLTITLIKGQVSMKKVTKAYAYAIFMEK